MIFTLPEKDGDNVPKKWEKVSSYIQLWRFGCPVIRSMILTDVDDLNDLKQIREYIGSDYCSLRFQYIRPSSSPIRGGNIFPIGKESLSPFFNDERIIWIMEPVNRLRYRFGVNIGINTITKDIIYEIVGRGFDASDITRGVISPHQIITMSSVKDKMSSKLSISSEICDDDVFQNSKNTRLECLKAMGMDSDISIFDKTYQPITTREIEQVYHYIKKVIKAHHYSDIIISCVILDNSDIFFWDIQFPKEKARILSNVGNESGGIIK